jgi:predicted AAA+ superfamily ATPase
LIYGGFPEPLSKKDPRTLRLWHQNRLNKLIRTDIRDIGNIKEIDKLELMAEELPNRIGSPLSLKSLAEDLEVDPKTIKRWIESLNTLYYCFQIAPYGAPKIRAVKKEKKIYLWDWSQIENEGLRFENLVASHLLKFCHHLEDTQGYKMELRYIRDTDKREVDFVVIKNKVPLFAVECKLKERSISPNIIYFNERLKIPKFYQVHSDLNLMERQVTSSISIVPFDKFCLYEKLV